MGLSRLLGCPLERIISEKYGGMNLHRITKNLYQISYYKRDYAGHQ